MKKTTYMAQHPALGEVEVTEIDPGKTVLCDDCSGDFTESSSHGGLLFGSKAICPACAPKWEANAKRYNEEQYIRARCPVGKSFAGWVREDLR